MILPPIGSDPMDIYSQPQSQEKTKLATIFHLNLRDLPEKPGRSLSVVWDKRCPLVANFENNYEYIVKFKRKSEKAGNHYHSSKQEIFIPLSGQIRVYLKNPATGESESVILNSDENKVLYVPSKIAHVAVSDSDICSLLVLATFPNNLADEFPYQIDF